MLRTVNPEATTRKSTRRWFASLLLLLGAILFAASLGAFAFDWFTATPVDVNPVSNGVWHKKIEAIRPGERVVGENPIEAPDSTFGEVDPATWKQLTLRAPKQDGDYCDIKMLRPDWWLEEKGASPGESIYIDVEELGIHDAVDVLEIAPCPDIPDGAGHVVTATFHHSAGAVYQLRIESGEPIGVTGNHPFYSADRREFTAAADLRIGETIQTLAGPKRVLSRTRLPGEHLVYNLEIHGQHVYHVGANGILVHNNYVKYDGPVYHGTNQPNGTSVNTKGLDVDDWRKAAGGAGVDEKGFSVTTDPEIAKAWADARAAERGGKPVVLEADGASLPLREGDLDDLADPSELFIDPEDFPQVGPGTFEFID